MKKKIRSTLKSCKRCSSFPAVCGEKYCKNCRNVVLSELRDSGYLIDLPQMRKHPMSGSGKGYTAVNSMAVGGSAEINSDGDEW